MDATNQGRIPFMEISPDCLLPKSRLDDLVLQKPMVELDQIVSFSWLWADPRPLALFTKMCRDINGFFFYADLNV